MFHSWILYHILETVHAEFLLKANGRADSLGVKWKPLKKNTEIYKPIRRGEIPGKERRRIREGRVSRRVALQNRKTQINIRTGRLIKSLMPGKVVRGLYVPPNSDQDVKITSRGIAFNLKVPYADDVQDARPFLPGNWDPWMSQAIQKALPNVIEDLRAHAYI